MESSVEGDRKRNRGSQKPNSGDDHDWKPVWRGQIKNV